MPQKTQADATNIRDNGGNSLVLVKTGRLIRTGREGRQGERRSAYAGKVCIVNCCFSYHIGYRINCREKIATVICPDGNIKPETGRRGLPHPIVRIIPADDEDASEHISII